MQRKRADFFLPHIGENDQVLEVGSGSGWFKDAIGKTGRGNYHCIDLFPPADFVGDILEWQSIGLVKESFDVVVAFEVVEHVDCFQACWDLLKPGGKMLITTPVPHFDWAMKILESLRLNQQRTSPHSNLVYLSKVPFHGSKKITHVLALSQWAIFAKAS
jgi:cyclopropane fatty-acyl-phospholipid synthase-like methyltransferase